MDQKTFHWADYLVFGLSLVISLAIGIYFAVGGNKQKTTSEYFMGDRKMKIIPVAMSILVTFVSGIDMLGNPAEVYNYGSMYSLYVFAQLIGCFVSAFIVVPLLYPLKLTSVTEYYELRFQSRILRYIISLMSLLCMGFVNGILLFAPAIALGGVTNIPVWVSIVVVGVAATIYTAIGGIKAVVWTDCFQCLIIVTGLVTVAIQGTIAVGGIGRVWELNSKWNRIKFIDFDLDPTKRLTIWSVLVMNSMLWLFISASQPTVQRYSALPTMRKAKIAIVMNSPSFFVSGCLTCYIGLVAFAYYADKGCDPIQSGLIYNPNQIFPYFVLDVLNVPGLTGLFIACLFSASLSSISSAINSMAAITYEDYLKHLLTRLPDSTQAQITKLTVFIYGLCGIAWAFVVKSMGGTLIQITYTVVGAVAGPIVGVLFVGATIPKVGKLGVSIGFFASLSFSVWLGLGATFRGHHAPMSPAPTYACEIPSNTSLMNLNSSYTDSVHHAFSNNDTGHEKSGVIITSENYHLYLQGLDRFYSISYLLYPGIGIILVYIVSTILLIIPATHQKPATDERYIIPLLRGVCCTESQKVSTYSDDEKVPALKTDYNVNEYLTSL